MTFPLSVLSRARILGAFPGLLLALALSPALRAQIVVGQQIGVDLTTDAEGPTSSLHWTAINAFESGLNALDWNTGEIIDGVTVGFATNQYGDFNTLSGTAFHSAFGGTYPEMRDGAYGASDIGTPSVLTLSFAGLDDNLRYTLEVFSASNSHDLVDFPVINGVLSAWDSGFTTAHERYDQPTGALFVGLATDGSGNLTFGVSDATAYNAIMNGAILTATSAIPEPSTYAALFGALALGTALSRRRSA